MSDDAPITSDEASAVERFNDVFARHYATVLAYLYRRTTEAFDAEEIAAATFVTAWRRLDDVPAEPGTRKWLLFVARRNLSNNSRTRRRRARLLRRLEVLDVERPPASLAPEADRDPTILEAFARLRPGEQEVLRLVHWDGFSHAEAAVILGCTVNAFDVRLYRAREALRLALAAIESGSTDRRRSRRHRKTQESEVSGDGA